MKFIERFHFLLLITALAAMVSSCSNNRDNNPFNNQLNGNGNGFVNSGNNEVITSFETLQQRIEQRYDVDLQLLQSGSKIACKYWCVEETRFPKLGCIRVFRADGGKMAYTTYNAQFEFWNNTLNIDANIGREISGASGFVTKDNLKANLFSLPHENITLFPQNSFLYGVGNIVVYPIRAPLAVSSQSSFNTDGRVGVSPQLPAAANLLMGKSPRTQQRTDTWCTVQ